LGAILLCTVEGNLRTDTATCVAKRIRFAAAEVDIARSTGVASEAREHGGGVVLGLEGTTSGKR